MLHSHKRPYEDSKNALPTSTSRALQAYNHFAAFPVAGPASSGTSASGTASRTMRALQQLLCCQNFERICQARQAKGVGDLSHIRLCRAAHCSDRMCWLNGGRITCAGAAAAHCTRAGRLALTLGWTLPSAPWKCRMCTAAACGGSASPNDAPPSHSAASASCKRRRQAAPSVLSTACRRHPCVSSRQTTWRVAVSDKHAASSVGCQQAVCRLRTLRESTAASRTSAARSAPL